jgi:hypothetical protein
MLKGVGAAAPTDLESHFRYLSGLLLGLGLAFAWCVPAIERRTLLFRTLGLVAVLGGLARLLGWSSAACRAPAIYSVWRWSWARCRCSCCGKDGWPGASAPGQTEGPPGLSPTTLPTWSAAGCSSPEDPKELSPSSPERAEPTSLLNHETSDHLLSLVVARAG